ncbi:MAG TPA: hypothetical protein VHY84_03960 [Bryobacteraceae bacterium]|jgi:hypothetical protein|nr:hypothetical protein [Bryobacteraceae bacterium]
MDHTERRLKVAELCISGVSFMVALGVAIVGYNDFAAKQTEALETQKQVLKAQQQEVKKSLHDAQLNLCEEVVTTASSVFNAENIAQLNAGLDRFELLSDGKAFTLLEPKVLHAMVGFANEAAHFAKSHASSPGGDAFQDAAQCALGERGFEVVQACRQMVSKAFTEDSGGAIPPLDSHYNFQFVCPAKSEAGKQRKPEGEKRPVPKGQ